MPCDNTGTTPANVTAQGFFSATLPVEPTEEQFVAGRPLIQSVLIGPKANRNVGNFNATELSLFGVQLPDEGSDIVATPTIQTAAASNPHYFWGWVSYHDVFPKTDLHITEFCQVLAGISLDRSNASLPFGFGYIPCGHHNCADKYCEDYVSIVALAAKN
jgi:hypothetical protein